MLAWIHWRRAVWLGKGLRGEKGETLLTMLQWGFQHQRSGDAFCGIPAVMKGSFAALRHHASDTEEWGKFLKDMKPEGWVWRSGTGARRSKRRTSGRLRKQNERSLRKAELRRSLVGRQQHRYPTPPYDVPEGELHVYTDGSAKLKRGVWKAGCGVWFGHQSPHNISTSPRGKQTVNRAELSAIILAIRKALHWDTPFSRLVVFSDSLLCIDGMRVYRHRWKLDGWTRRGQPLQNADLWRLMDRILVAAEAAEFDLVLNHLPSHVGIVGNECADKLAKAAVRLAFRAVTRSAAERVELEMDGMADAMVAAMTSDFLTRQQSQEPEPENDPLQWQWVPFHLRQ